MKPGAGSPHFDYTRTRIQRQGRHGYLGLRWRRRTKEWLWYLGVFFLFALVYVWTRVQVTDLAYRLRKLAEQREGLKEVHYGLTLKAATLRSPQVLEQQAVRFGLVKPGEAQVVIVKDEGSF